MAHQDKSKNVIFIPYIDPFIWVYLLVTGKLFRQVLCFRYRFVPSWGFSRIKTADLELSCYLAARKHGVDFAAQLMEDRSESHIDLDGLKIDIGGFQKKNICRYCCDLSVSMAILGLAEVRGTAFLEAGFLDREESRRIKAWFESETEFKSKRSWFLTLFHPLLIRVVVFAVTFWFYLKNALRRGNKKPDQSGGKLLMLNVEPAYQGLDPAGELSACFLIDGKTIKKNDIMFEIADDEKRQQWERQGYFCIPEVKSIKIDHLPLRFFGSAFGALARTASLISSRSLLDVYMLLAHASLVRSGAVKGLLYTNSVYEHEPVAALAYRALGKDVAMLCYSASLYEGPHWAYMTANRIFVWDKKMAEFIQSHPQQEKIDCITVGPVMFAHDDEACTLKSVPSPSRRWLIGIYGVTPKPQRVIEDARLTTNYSERFFEAFIDDIASLRQLDETMDLKIKQKYNGAEMDMLKRQRITQEESGTNPYRSLADCDLIICMPFTSIGYAGRYYGVPCIYYSPEEGMVFNSVNDHRREIVCGCARLHEVVAEIMAKASRPSRDASRPRSVTRALREKIGDIYQLDAKISHERHDDHEQHLERIAR